MPWTSKRLPGWKFKDIQADPNTGSAAWLIFVPPNWTTSTGRHYDHENGWTYFLEGEFGVVYYSNPQDQTGTLYTVRPGDVFYGVAGAIHNFDSRTLFPEGSVLLSWHDRPTAITKVPFESTDTTLNGNPWPVAKMVHSSSVDWEKTDLGFIVKKLYSAGTAALEMRYYPPAWKSSGQREYATYNRWMYVLEGQMDLRLYRFPTDMYGNVVRVAKGEVIEIPSHSIFGGGNTMESGESGTWALIWREQAGDIVKLE